MATRKHLSRVAEPSAAFVASRVSRVTRMTAPAAILVAKQGAKSGKAKGGGNVKGKMAVVKSGKKNGGKMADVKNGKKNKDVKTDPEQETMERDGKRNLGIKSRMDR